MQKKQTLQMVGNGHIDPVWLWQWQEGYHEVRATFRSALDRMKESDDFVFTASSAAFYEWIEEMDPALFAEVQQRVAEGRLDFVGGWWIEPDCNIPSGESFARHGLYAQRFFKEKFGRIASVGFNPDSFGHNATLPQIFNKQGMQNYVFMRPGPHEKNLPEGIFWWESADGSRVLCFRIVRSYNSWGEGLRTQVEETAREMHDPYNDLMCFYGVGNHGGGPTIANIAQIRELQQDKSLPELCFSSPTRYFAELDAQALNAPVVKDDLQHHASGCYAAQSGVKRWNRLAENALVRAEKWAALAHRLVGTPYPKTEIRHAWKLVLFNQFHDILAGSSLKEAYDDAERAFNEAISIAQRIENRALQSILWQIDVPLVEGKTPLVVFNPHAWQAQLPVEVEVRGRQKVWALKDSAGNSLAFQCVLPHATVTNATRISFIADLPSLGYQIYWLEHGSEQAGEIASASALSSAPARSIPSLTNILESGSLRLEIDPQTGLIRSLRDVQSGKEYFSAPAARATVIHDDSDTWSHGIFTFDREVGEFHLHTITCTEDGPVQRTVRVESGYNLSNLVQTFTLYKALKRIDVKVEVDWHEQFKMLKLQFPVNAVNPKATYEIAYGHIEKACDGVEEAGQSWVDVSGEGLGVSFLNDGKYSFSVKDNVFGLTVLRSPIYAHHEPKVPEADTHYDFMDQGLQEFRYTILPHDGCWCEADAVRRAAELNQQPAVIITTVHTGPLPSAMPPAQGLVGGLPRNVVLSVVKQAEDDDALILRAYETEGKTTPAEIMVWGLNTSLTTVFAPYEIKTLRVAPDGSAREVNLLEW